MSVGKLEALFVLRRAVNSSSWVHISWKKSIWNHSLQFPQKISKQSVSMEVPKGLGTRGVKELECTNDITIKEHLFLLISNENVHAQHFIEG